MADNALRIERNQLFQELKPRCVTLSQLALKSDGSPSSLNELRQATSRLFDVLQKCRRSDGVFDEKLADYVFFPLSQILRINQKTPGQLAELATKCLQILLEYGWRTISIDLARQLLILLTYFATPESPDAPEELKKEAFIALGLLFQDLSRTPKGPASLIEVEVIPALGQCITTVLDGVTEGPSPEIQLEALQTLQSIWSCVKDQEALSNFLPGTISALTKCLNPTTQIPRTRKVLIRGLNVLQVVLSNTVGDIRTRNFKDGEDDKHPTLTKSWLKATAAKIKLALANVVKLRSHSHEDVRQQLNKFCIAILDECQNSLSDSQDLLVETSLMLSDTETDGQTRLKDLAMIYPPILELVKNTIYNWTTSLPRIMQSADESAKSSALNRLSKAFHIFSDLNINSDVLEDAFIDSLRNSVMTVLESPAPGGVQEVTEILNSSLILTNEPTQYQDYSPVIMGHGSQVEVRSQLDNLLTNISAGPRVKISNEILAQSRNASGNALVSSFWLSFQLLKVSSKQNEVDAFLSSDLTQSDEDEALLDELYSNAVIYLSESEFEEEDWRLRAISTEVVAYCAQHFGEEFRPDLVDVLYPVVQLLGSPNTHLREHAMTTLNIMANSCNYSSTSEMVIQNVDYLVNSVSLKLNTFDISPQAPQVLVMMIKLSGSSLLPYLDDVVGSIFAALDNFHGYPKLVDSLFSVLGEIVDESGRSGQLRIQSGSEISHKKVPPAAPKISEICALLEKSKNKSRVDKEAIEHEDFPRQPWKSAQQLLDEAEAGETAENEDEESGEIQKVPPGKVYTMVQSIARLGQHYLTNQSPTLRRRLLDLISTACVALHNNEDEFLPLVNDIWPVVIRRLHDEESFVVIAAANTISEICRCAGDFMSTRIKTEWNDLMKTIKQAQLRSKAEKDGKHGRGIFSQNWQVWNSFVDLLVTLVEYVRIEDEMFDDILDILQDLLSSREDIHRALSTINADAVWLCQLGRGEVQVKSPPSIEGYQFVEVRL